MRVLLGRLEGLGAAVPDQGASGDLEFVALCVAAEIIMVVEDQDACARVALFEQERGGQAAETCADNHQVVVTLGISHRTEVSPPGSRKCVCDLVRALVIAAHAGLLRWVVVEGEPACRFRCG